MNNEYTEKHYLDQAGLDRVWKKILALKGQVDARTTEEWNTQGHGLISVKGMLYVWLDRSTYEGQNIPGVKVGDGGAYVLDLPFVDAEYAAHIADMKIHVSETDRKQWEGKVTCRIDPHDSEKLIFTTN